MTLSELIRMLQKIKRDYQVIDPDVTVNGYPDFDIIVITHVKQQNMLEKEMSPGKPYVKEIRINNL